MNDNEFIKVIGFDLGHGEFSLAEVPMQLGEQPQTIEINKRETQITAVGKDQKGQTIIGRNAVRKSDMQSFEICFKKKPSICSTLDKQSIHDFVTEVYNHLIKDKRCEEPENTYFFVGCPSGWQVPEKDAYEQMITGAGLPNVSIVRESRAALLHAKEIQRIRPSDLAKSVLVIDIGSSTTDFTWVIDKNDNPIDFGKKLGASLIDKEIFKRTLDAHPNKEGLEEIFQKYPVFENRCEFACRVNKEEYFRNPDDYHDSRSYVRAAFEDIQRLYEFKPLVNGPIMREILDEPMKELGNKSWKSAFRDNLRAVKQELDAQGITPSKIMLTGGASRMDFISTICENIFSSDWIRDTQPELAIARGLARWGRININTGSFSSEANQILDRELESIVESHIQDLINNQAKKLANGAVNNGLKPQLIQWRDGKISTSEELDSKVKQQAEKWLIGTEASQIITSELSNWLPTVSKQVEEKLSPLYDEYGLSQAALGMTTFKLKPKTEGFSTSIFIKEAITYTYTDYYTTGTTAGAVTGGVIGAIGGGATAAAITAAELALGPVGWAALGVGALGAVIGGLVGTTTETEESSQEIRDLSDQDIEQKVSKQKEVLFQEIQKTFINDPELKKELIQQMSQVLKDAIQEKVDKARLLIASDDG